MDHDRAARLLAAERHQLEQLLNTEHIAARQERTDEIDLIAVSDGAAPLASQGVDDAVVASLEQRLEAVRRAERRLADGVYGRSVLSGLAIPDERLEADPAAETTVDEARQR